ncbi:TPA: metal-dependent hydrolase [Candidatus Woesearchaeota archaeon]|nr:metal-dependent hydrolase [Candidatus Woesearchaeota archaeon]HIG93640.1 metal-dependent hydrolase [Candidatus Woesearchaeota archaeon]HIH12740.1 metal-dependent hydrolase [Candidatus Woesearchaeota archaeon]
MFAFTHLISAWLLGKGYEFIWKKKISHLAWFFLLFGSLFSDADFLIDWTFGTEIHRTFTHSLLFLAVAPLLLYFTLTLLKWEQKKSCSYALAVGIASHLLLDMIMSRGVPLFWPSLINISFTQIGYFDPQTPSFLHASANALQKVLKVAIFDMALGTTWIFYFWYKKRIQF